MTIRKDDDELTTQCRNESFSIRDIDGIETKRRDVDNDHWNLEDIKNSSVEANCIVTIHYIPPSITK
jgi:hypothetical protein